MQPEDDEEDDGANIDLDAQRRGKCVVLKTSTRQTIFLPVVGLVDAEALKPADLVGVNKVEKPPCSAALQCQVLQLSSAYNEPDSGPNMHALSCDDVFLLLASTLSEWVFGGLQDSYLILDTLPAEYDSRVKAMEVDEKPTEDYSDIGGLDKQIQELVEAIVLPVTHKVSI